MPRSDHRPFRFIAVGLFVTAVDLGLTYLVVQLSGTRVLAVTIGFVAGLLASYVLHAVVSFSAPLAPTTQFPKFLMLVALNYVETIGVVMIATEWFGSSTIVGKLISLPIVATSSYLVSYFWIYATHAGESS